MYLYTRKKYVISPELEFDTAKNYKKEFYTAKKIQIINLGSFVAQDLNMIIEILYIFLPSSANMNQINQLFKSIC